MIALKTVNLIMNYKRFIESIPGKRFGSPCLKGTRIAVSDVLNWIASGMSEKDILRDYPELTKEQISACLAFEADHKKS